MNIEIFHKKSFICKNRSTEQLRAVVGQGYLNVNETEEMTFEVEYMVLHPQYKLISLYYLPNKWLLCIVMFMYFSNPEGTISNDLALLKIQRKGDGNGIQFTDLVAPACLPLEDTPQKPGTECTISGWGRTDCKNCTVLDNLDGEKGTAFLLIVLTEIPKDACMMSAVVPIVSDDQCRSWYSQSTMVWSNGKIK